MDNYENNSSLDYRTTAYKGSTLRNSYENYLTDNILKGVVNTEDDEHNNAITITEELDKK